MVDEGRLEVGGASAQKLCLVSITYHNIAVERVLLFEVCRIVSCLTQIDAGYSPFLRPSASLGWVGCFQVDGHRKRIASRRHVDV